jgi:hypothetical protein
MSQANHESLAGWRHAAYPIQAVGGQGVGRPQQLEKVVGPEVVSYKAEYGLPHIGFDPEALRPGLPLVGLWGSAGGGTEWWFSRALTLQEGWGGWSACSVMPTRVAPSSGIQGRALTKPLQQRDCLQQYRKGGWWASACVSAAAAQVA